MLFLGGSILKTVASFGRGLFKKDRLENVKSELANAGVHLMTVVDALVPFLTEIVPEIPEAFKVTAPPELL